MSKFDIINDAVNDILASKAKTDADFRVGYLKALIYEIAVAHPEAEGTILTLRDFLNSKESSK